MTRDSIPDAVTPVVTSTNPYAVVTIPAIGRVLDAIRALATTLDARSFQVSNRALARAAGLRSAGKMPDYLRQLDADGHISYDPVTSLVMITDEIDHGGDRSNSGSAPQCAPPPPPDHGRDRPYKEVGLMRSQEEEGRARATNDPPVVRLLRSDKAHPTVIRRILDAIPGLTPERYLAEKGWWQRFKAGTGIGYLFRTLMNGSTLGTESEASDALRGRRPAARPPAVPDATSADGQTHAYQRPRSGGRTGRTPGRRYDVSEYADILAQLASSDLSAAPA